MQGIEWSLDSATTTRADEAAKAKQGKRSRGRHLVPLDRDDVVRRIVVTEIDVAGEDAEEDVAVAEAVRQIR